MNQGGAPIVILRQNTSRQHGRKAQLTNIQAGKAISEIVRTTLGPKSMLKMILDPMGGIVMTNDGNAILREVDVAHPAAKSMIELSRCQDEEVGDGTTSVVVLAGEMLTVAETHLMRNMHPTVIVSAYMQALDDALKIMDDVAIKVDAKNDQEVIQVIESCLNTKFSSRLGDLITKMALKATRYVCIELPSGKKNIDIKRFAKVEKVPGGDISECCVLDGVMVNKDVVHAKMRRYIENPKVLLLDCPLEYKKGESQTNVEITREEDWAKLLEQEELEVQKMCSDIIASGCNVVVTEKGVSDLAQHYLVKNGISCIRRVRKTDNNRISRVCGATICNRTEEVSASDLGAMCKRFEVKKIGDEFFTFFTHCENPTACTILLRGASKDVLNEIERNLADALNVSRNILMDAKLLHGGGAIEMELACRLTEMSKSIEGPRQLPYRSVAAALEVIPRTLAQNCGSNVVRVVTDLRARHAKSGEGVYWGIDGNTGQVADVRAVGIWDTLSVKQQIIKAAIESAAMLLRIDDVVSGIKKSSGDGHPKVANYGAPEDGETFGDSRDG